MSRAQWFGLGWTAGALVTGLILGIVGHVHARQAAP